METVMAEPTDTRALLERARQGDREAFGQLASLASEALLDRIRLQVGQRLRGKIDLEDVVQEVLLRAFESIERFQGQDEGSFRRWLEGIARNVIRNLARRKGWKKELELTRDLSAGNVSPSRRQRQQERFERLSEAVEGLSPDYRTVIKLARIEGLKISEIATRMNRSPSAVKNLLLRAMRQLKKSFGETESFSLPERRLGEKGETGDD
jgi:RNA polymerase sigma-70 factor (ECF subfamily)